MNLVDFILAFFEGFALIISPCILPVLPLVLSASIDGGKKRPLGIITGFVLSFSLFALLSKQLVVFFHVDLELIKYFSLGLLALFGLLLLSDRLSEKLSGLTQGIANFGMSVSPQQEGGFQSGLVIGALIGLVWTPCAGPILAAVLVQVIRQQTEIASLFVILAFSIGVGLPMLAIALAGRKLLEKFSFLTKNTHLIRKILGVMIILSTLLIGFNFNPGDFFKKTPTFPAITGKELSHGLSHSYRAPEFVGIEKWFNSPALTLESLRGKVVLVDFWTYSCVNCVRTFPYLKSWDQQYRDKGLVIVGVHSPEFEFEKNPDNVKRALEKYGITYPVALDNQLSTWTAFQNLYWPAHYLINQNGEVVYTHFGEGNYDVTENNIRYLLGIKGTSVTPPQANIYHFNQTPETYLGVLRAQRYVGVPSSFSTGTTAFQFAHFIPLHAWSLSGQWKVENERIISDQKDAKIRLHFQAKKVFLVMGTVSGKALQIQITLNDKPIATKEISNHALYEVIQLESSQNGILEITATGPGLECYAFTFE